MSTAPTIDYAQTKAANQNRDEKAIALAKHAWRCGLTGERLLALSPVARRTFARAAGVNVPKEDSPTWPLVAAKLDAFTAWAHAHPGQAPAQDLIAAEEDGATPAPTPLPRAPRPPTPVGADVVLPNGWALLAALAPLERAGTGCLRCGAPSLVGTPDGFRCAAHPPQRGEWGATLNWAPNKTGPCLVSRCYCGRCDHYAVT